MPDIPPNARQWGNIWATIVEARKDGHREVQESKQSNDDGDDDGNGLEDREKEDHQTDEKEEYGYVKEYARGFECSWHAIFQDAKEQQGTDARFVSRKTWDLR